MFDVKKPKQKPIVVIRAATGKELSEYEKHKLASIEKNAQENKIEVISLNVDGHKQRIEPLNKEVQIDLGSLALSSSVTPADMSTEDLFVIKCELNDTELVEQN
jgi:ABC-type Zn uptake system ZnuABC Zn-binding protein ZnuA